MEAIPQKKPLLSKILNLLPPQNGLIRFCFVTWTRQFPGLKPKSITSHPPRPKKVQGGILCCDGKRVATSLHKSSWSRRSIGGDIRESTRGQTLEAHRLEKRNADNPLEFDNDRLKRLSSPHHFATTSHDAHLHFHSSGTADCAMSVC